MNNKILIVYPRLEPHKEHHYVPYSALCVASKLMAEGREVEIIDDRILNNIEDILLECLERSTNIDVYFSVYTGYQVTRAYHLSGIIKAKFPDVKITWGGPHVDIYPQQTLADNNVDYINPGYAEHGEYPMPWNLINIKDYINPETERFIYISTYGCVGICTFCATKKRRKWIEIPIEKVKDDINYLMELYPYKECVFFDATIFTRKQRAFEISELMRQHNLKWIADARADEIIRMPEDILDSIMSSGVTRLTIGLESGSARVVSWMKKGKRHLENYKKCAEIMAKYPVKMCSGVIFGCPGETPDDITQTIEYIKEIKRINPNFYISTTFFMPLPGTEMADMAKEYGYKEPQTLKEWAEYGENGHFRYNDWMDNPWIQGKDEYKRIYDTFIDGCDFLI